MMKAKTPVLKKLHWIDVLLLILVGAVTAVIWQKIDGAINYTWRWEIIPSYIVRQDAETGAWSSNMLLQGFLLTLRLSIYASILALILGVILGTARCSQVLVVKMLARTYMELLRNIPPIVIIFVFYFFLSEQIIAALEVESWARQIARQENNGIWILFFGDMRQFPEFISGCVVLALFESAFIGEIVRAGIQSVPQGQIEAGQSIGLRRFDVTRLIVLPQAIRKVLPPLANQFIVLIKDSAFISLIAVQELTYKTTEVVATTRAVFEAWLTTAAFYFVLCFALSMIFRRLESSGRNTRQVA